MSIRYGGPLSNQMSDSNKLRPLPSIGTPDERSTSPTFSAYTPDLPSPSDITWNDITYHCFGSDFAWDLDKACLNKLGDTDDLLPPPSADYSSYFPTHQTYHDHSQPRKATGYPRRACPCHGVAGRNFLEECWEDRFNRERRGFRLMRSNRAKGCKKTRLRSGLSTELVGVMGVDGAGQ